MNIQFMVNYAETQMGQNLFIIGNREFLGNWNVSSLSPMKFQYDNMSKSPFSNIVSRYLGISHDHLVFFDQVSKALPMKTGPGLYPRWMCQKKVHINNRKDAGDIQYKFIIVHEHVSIQLRQKCSFF